MAGKEAFTEEEWDQLKKGVIGSALLVSVSDPGFFETFKEAGAVGRHLAEAKQGNSSELIRDLAESPGMAFGLGSTPEKVETETLESLRAAASTLNAKAPEELPAYRQFVEEVAQSVAAAAEDVGTAETTVIEKVRAALATG